MPEITLDGRTVSVPPGATLLEAARLAGVPVPTLCHREGCEAETSCMVCVVRVNGSPRLRPACATRAEEGMVVQSETEEVHAARRTALELLLSDHLGDCVGPCHSVCPAHLDIPGMMTLVAQGRMPEAVALVRERIPLPAILGRICPRLCEKGCRRGQLDTPLSICEVKRTVGEWALVQAMPQPARAEATGKRVAVVGAGPAGLSAAYVLALRGHECRVYDENLAPGGALRYRVPETVLSREVLEAEVVGVLSVGVQVRCGVRVGRDLSLGRLRDEYDAVILTCGTCGAAEAGELGVPAGRQGLEADRHTHETDLPGVYAAGGALHPTHHAVQSVGSGVSVALHVHGVLMGDGPSHWKPWSVHMGKLGPVSLQRFTAGASQTPRVEPALPGGGLSPEQAALEASRCLHCECAGAPDCRLLHWAREYQASAAHYRDSSRIYQRETSHPELVYEPGKCIACGLCVQLSARHGDAVGLTFEGRGFGVRIGVPLGEPLSGALRAAARECAEACPTAALRRRETAVEASDEGSEAHG